VTGEPLIQRDDDNEKTVKKRYENYKKVADSVFNYYKAYLF
jgi:Adenylate kinase and related kinases